MDRRRSASTERATSALASRLDSSRVVPFDAPTGKLCGNPFNPRDPSDPKVQELANSMQTVGQLQTAVVVTREVFIEAYPDAEADVPESAQWVTVMGNRRLAAAVLAGRQTLEVVIAQDIATVEMIEYAIIHENLHRADLPPLREAGMFQAIMEREGITARQLADKVGKSHTYVNQRLSLNKLLPEFQELLTAGDLGMKDARSLAVQTEDRQREILAVWPQLSKLVPAARALYDDGELSPDDLNQLAALSAADQRKQLALAATGNRVSTQAVDDNNSTEEPGGGNPVSTTPEPANSQDEAPEKATATPWQVAKYVRRKLDPAGVDELIQILTSE